MSEENENNFDDEKIRCPKCSSEQVQVGKKGFDNTKGICGFALCGPLGLLAGQQGAKDLQRTCMKCGHSW